MSQPKETPSTEDNAKLTAGTLREWIKQEIAGLIPSSTSGAGSKSAVDSATPGAPTDIRAEVKAALGELKSKEDRQAKDARVDKMLEEYEKPVEETPPAERRRVEKFMKWGD